MAIVIQLLSKNFKPLQHYVVDKDYVRIGRSYDNDVVLDDPYVCSHHLRIEAKDHSLSYTDIGSLNGVRKNNKQSVSGCVDMSDVLTVGRCQLRIFSSETPVSPTLKLSALEEKISFLNNTALLFALTFMAFAVLMADNYLSTFEEFKIGKALPAIVSKMLVLSMWPLILLLLAKLAKKDARATSLFNLTWVFLLLHFALEALSNLLNFNFAKIELAALINMASFALLVFTFIWFSLFIAFHQSGARRNVLTLIATAIILLPTKLLGMLLDDEFTAAPQYDATVLPPAYILRTPDDMQTYLEQSRQQFDQFEAPSVPEH